MRRRGLIAAGLAALAQTARGQEALAVLASRPAANAMLAPEDRRFFVRFDQPVDHIRSRLIIRRGNHLVALLEPRLEAEPDLLFATAPQLQPGRYRFEWQVISLAGALIADGGVDFTVMG